MTRIKTSRFGRSSGCGRGRPGRRHADAGQGYPCLRVVRQGSLGKQLTSKPVRSPAPRWQLIKALEIARGNGTSMISLIMPPKDQVGLWGADVPGAPQLTLSADRVSCGGWQGNAGRWQPRGAALRTRPEPGAHAPCPPPMRRSALLRWRACRRCWETSTARPPTSSRA